MRKLLTIVCALALVAALPGIASGRSQRAQARLDAIKTCKQLRSAAGKKNFAAMFGRNAYGKCVSKESHENRVEAQQAQETAQKNAAKQCKAERSDPNFSSSHDGKTFQQFYGTNGNGKNAYGKCVSQHAKQNREQEDDQNRQEDQNQVSAAKQCKAEQGDSDFSSSHDGKSFSDFYGTNKNHRNAFGKCVSKKAHEMNQQDQEGSGQQS